MRDESRVQELPDATAPDSEAPSKAILLFSDGTGNSSAKLFKTNVWRLYEAVDLGPAPPGKRVQIAYYDNGVGTSGFRPIALLGGIFGWGLKRNVLRIYTFLCRNYVPRDKIYAFGFSRGAFTIRILVALIAKQGVLLGHDDADLAYLVRDAYRDYCRDNLPRRWPPELAVVVRGIRDGFIRLKRRLAGQKIDYRTARRHYTDIEFVGVWDTVAAYGGPFVELTRGIDDWVWPLTMPNYGLSVRVRRARHALSLDDERDAFQPLLWDEHIEWQQITSGGIEYDQANDGTIVTSRRKVEKKRLRQVWFVGVHSDVGGGYPDESLSYTSLTWMMDELAHDLRFIPQFASRAQSLSNALGPIHDSRAGLAAYYRYQPRKIAALLDPPRPETVSMRDPQIRDEKTKRPHGLLKRVLVHESVLARIASGVDNYAPSALPANFIPILATGPYALSSLSTANLQALTRTSEERRVRYQRQENDWDRVWRRRVTYFLTVFATLLLVALPFLPGLSRIEDLCSDDRCFALDISRLVLFYLPQSFQDWLVPWAKRPIGAFLLLILIGILIWRGKRGERTFRDRVRTAWMEFRGGGLEGRRSPAPTRLRRFRESRRYQFVLFDLKWRFLPLIFGIGALLAIFYAGVIVATQTLYAFAEPHEYFCAPRGPSDTAARLVLSRPCNDLQQPVVRAQAYRIVITPKEDWTDKGIPADPRTGARDETAAMVLARPLKRVTHAHWLQPVAEVRAGQTGWLRNFEWLVGKDIELRRLRFEPDGKGNYVSTDLCPRRSGQLYLMVNDGAPLLSSILYSNNSGTAEVTVEPLHASCVPIPERDCSNPHEQPPGYCPAR